MPVFDEPRRNRLQRTISGLFPSVTAIAAINIIIIISAFVYT